MSWQALGAVPPTGLVEARLQLHHAAQVVASAGVTYLPPEPDDSHPNLGWDDAAGALAGRALPGSGVRVRTALRVADLTLLLLDASGKASDELALGGRTLEDAYTWLSDATVRAGATLPAAGLSRASYEIPAHATGSGAAFEGASPALRQALAELSRWFANAFLALEDLAARLTDSEVRCWPHHFDVGGLATVATHPDGSLAQSIGFGLSPGDDGYAEPYWYVSPWPYPAASTLPELGLGARWHTEGHTSAILTGSDAIAGAASAEDQAARANAFLEGAVAASRLALDV